MIILCRTDRDRIVLRIYFGGVTQDNPPSKIAVAVVNRDDSEISRKVTAALAADAALDVKSRALEEARELVRGGKTTVAAVLPPGFAERAGKAFFRGNDKPEIQLLYDPSHGTEMQVVRGVLTQHVMEVVSRETLSGPSSQRLLDDALRDLRQIHRPETGGPGRAAPHAARAWASGTSGRTPIRRHRRAPAVSACRTP